MENEKDMLFDQTDLSTIKKENKKTRYSPGFGVLISIFLTICYVNIYITSITGIIMQDFDTLLKNSAAAHEHLCLGRLVGVRMAHAGMLTHRPG